ncbi:MAG: NAD-binding protein [Desulfurococcales archaeon]|nr:NAD-binding protein [Desulfurococcales archaeon]
MVEAAVVGLGNVGLRLAYDLASRGYKVLGFDSRGSRVERARKLGLEATTIDALSANIVYSKVESASVVAVAMPSEIGSRLSVELASRGLRVVDVSLLHTPPIRPVKGLLVAEAGASPGLTTLLAEAALKRRGEGGDLLVAAGSVSLDPEAPLGHAATWNVWDFLREYMEPGVVVVDGRVAMVDPLDPESWIELEWPGVGRLECFVGGGLKRFLAKKAPKLRRGLECSVRRPGHLKAMKLLRDLGLLSDAPVKASGCPVRPLDLLARLLERKSGGYKDLALVYVEYRGPGGRDSWLLSMEWSEGWSATSQLVGGMQATFTELVINGLLDDINGVVYPEDLASIGLESKVLSLAAERGIAATNGDVKLLSNLLR